MDLINITKNQAKLFLLRRHGLFGERIFTGKSGVLEFIKLVGSIQFDPVDVCGMNTELVLQSRVEGFNKNMLDELLYKDRKLIDFFDKCLCVFPVEDLPYFTKKRTGGGYATAYDSHAGEAVDKLIPVIQKLIKEQGSVSAKDIENGEDYITWTWGVNTSPARIALESLYYRGVLIVHHKTRTHKSYAFAEDYISSDILNAPNPFETEEEYYKWILMRRIGAVGILWNRASDAWLGIDNFKSDIRNKIFKNLLESSEITEIKIEGIRDSLYIKSSEKSILVGDDAHGVPISPENLNSRAEFIAPLDNLMWDRKLIKALFDFDYTWEIYTPKEKRKYAAYVLPVIYGADFAGRAEIERKGKENILLVKNLWLENGVNIDENMRAAFINCAERFAKFNSCGEVVYEKNYIK